MLQTTEQSKLMFNYIQDAILMEHSCLKANQLVKQTVSKLSAAKWKGSNPKWQPKQQLSEKKDDEESSDKKPCACTMNSPHMSQFLPIAKIRLLLPMVRPLLKEKALCFYNTMWKETVE